MTDVQKTLELIFIEAAKVFGKEESQKMLSKVFEDPKKAVPAKEEKTEEKPTKRISRMTATLANKLKAELVKVGITFSDDEKKEFDKFKKEFVSYVDDLTNDDFTAKGLEKHMEDFATLKKPSDEAIPAKAEKQKKTRKVKETEIPKPPNSNAAIDQLTLEELQAIEIIATPHGVDTGVYYDGDSGRYVRGPDEDDDEDNTVKKFKGKTYAIGEKTGRVYEVVEDKTKPDIFVGFIGVGAFAELKIN